jgi:DNA-binding MarR family transcriptional regulator
MEIECEDIKRFVGDENEDVQKLMECLIKFRKIHMNHHQMLGLKSNDNYLLFVIKKYVTQEPDGIKVSELSGLLNVTSPTITQQINSLEQNGYVERAMDKEDRRAVRIKLTEKGEEKLKENKDFLLKSTNELIEYLGTENSRKLTELLSMVSDFLANKSNQPFN